MPMFFSLRSSALQSNRKQKQTQRHFSFLRCLFYCRSFVFAAVLTALLITPAINVYAENTCPDPQQQLKMVRDWARVKYIVDGDTLHLSDGRKIRLIGINTPELGHRGEASQPYGQQAYQAVVRLLSDNKKVGLYYDKERKDRYKRTLAYIVLADGQSLEQYLLSQGLAVSIVVPPNSAHLNCYRALENQARQARKGLWQLPEMQWFNAHKLSAKAQGYRFVQAKVLAYNKIKKNSYLKLSSRVSVQISSKDRKKFSSLKSLVGKTIRVRGWLNRYKGKQNLRLRARENLEVL